MAACASDDDALVRLLPLVREQGVASCILEDLADALTCPGRAFEILLRVDLLCDGDALNSRRNGEESVIVVVCTALYRSVSTYLLGRHWPLRRLPQLLNGLRVATKVFLATDK